MRCVGGLPRDTARQPETRPSRRLRFVQSGGTRDQDRQCVLDAFRRGAWGLCVPDLRAQHVRADIDVDGKAVKLSPGRVLAAEVKTGRQRVTRHVLLPLKSTFGRARGERS